MVDVGKKVVGGKAVNIPEKVPAEELVGVEERVLDEASDSD